MNPISILITDDHTLLRSALVLLFKLDSRFQVIAECKSGEEAIEKVKTVQPAIILMDINLPGMNGFEACEAILSDSPAVKILGLSMNAEPVYASKMISCGAMGYITKNSPPEELFEAVMTIYNNRKYVCRDVKEKLRMTFLAMDGDKKELNGEEITFLCYLRLGFSIEEISEQPGFTAAGVEALLPQLLKKLKLEDLEALIGYSGSLQ